MFCIARWNYGVSGSTSAVWNIRTVRRRERSIEHRAYETVSARAGFTVAWCRNFLTRHQKKVRWRRPKFLERISGDLCIRDNREICISSTCIDTRRAEELYVRCGEIKVERFFTQTARGKSGELHRVPHFCHRHPRAQPDVTATEPSSDCIPHEARGFVNLELAHDFCAVCFAVFTLSPRPWRFLWWSCLRRPVAALPVRAA